LSHLFYLACFKIDITIITTLYAYMVWLLQYNLALNNELNIFQSIKISVTPKLNEENITPWIMISVHCINHYTNIAIQILSKMFTWKLSVCYKVYMHPSFTIQKEPKSFFLYIELNFESLLKSPELTIGHLKVGNFL
jgi:hypothetical protein